MAVWTPAKLSASTDGKGIKVAATSISSGTTIHTNDGTGTDYIDIYCTNSDTVSRTLTLGWGGTTDPDDLIRISIPSKQGLVAVALRIPLTNSLIVKAAADAANVLVIFGEIRKYV